VSAFIDADRERFGVEPICRVLGVSASAYHQRARGERSARAVEDERLLGRIRELHAADYYAIVARPSAHPRAPGPPHLRRAQQVVRRRRGSSQPPRGVARATTGGTRMRRDRRAHKIKLPERTQKVAVSSTDARTQQAANGTPAGDADLKLEVVVIPVSDVERAKEFYGRLGWRLDADFAFDNGFRIVQYTPPGSPCSIQFGTNMTQAAPGTAQDMYLVVADVEAARAELAVSGAQVSEVFHPAAFGDQFRADPSGHAGGPAPDRQSYGSFDTFTDPDGNVWLLQEITARLPGRIDADETPFATVADLAGAMRRAEAAHGEHEKRTGVRDENWPEWYASYMAAERGGTELPT
jgi:catechol 2,3-dioxygenase-like lactoylglutathione lyase family enzyme